MSRDLHGEVSRFLRRHGPAQADLIARSVCARLADVMAVLSQEGFSRAERPEGAHPRSVYWVASPGFPRSGKLTSRAAVLLEILADGEWHGRGKILERAGPSFLTNNAASDLRRAGYGVEYSAKAGYRLVSLALAAPEFLPRVTPLSGAASEPTRDLAVA